MPLLAVPCLLAQKRVGGRADYNAKALLAVSLLARAAAVAGAEDHGSLLHRRQWGADKSASTLLCNGGGDKANDHASGYLAIPGLLTDGNDGGGAD